MLYGLGVSLRNLFFDLGLIKSEAFAIPIVSVGNMTTGGSGKTPIVMYLVEHFRRNNLTPVVVSRGYGRKSEGPVIVSDGQGRIAGPQEGGDEPVMIAEYYPEVPVIVAERRVTAVRLAIERFRPDLIILDDAFQHRYVMRDCDIVLLDANRNLRREWLLPAGNRRELLHALKRADIFIYTKADIPDNIDHFNLRAISGSDIFYMQFIPVHYRDFFSGDKIEVSLLAGASVLAFTGIARPDNFRQMLIAQGVSVNYFKKFPDHYNYTLHDIRALSDLAHKFDCTYLVTTAKDAVKLKKGDFDGQKVLILEVQPTFSGGADLGQKVLEYIDKGILSD